MKTGLLHLLLRLNTSCLIVAVKDLPSHWQSLMMIQLMQIGVVMHNCTQAEEITLFGTYYTRVLFVIGCVDQSSSPPAFVATLHTKLSVGKHRRRSLFESLRSFTSK